MASQTFFSFSWVLRDGNSIALELACALDLVDVGHLGYLALWLLSFLLVVVRLRDFCEMKSRVSSVVSCGRQGYSCGWRCNVVLGRSVARRIPSSWTCTFYLRKSFEENQSIDDIGDDLDQRCLGREYWPGSSCCRVATIHGPLATSIGYAFGQEWRILHRIVLGKGWRLLGVYDQVCRSWGLGDDIVHMEIKGTTAV